MNETVQRKAYGYYKTSLGQSRLIHYRIILIQYVIRQIIQIICVFP